MKTHWTAALILSSALAAGCGDRGSEETRTPDDTADQAATGEAGRDQANREAVPPGDARGDTDTRATTGDRVAGGPGAAAPSSPARSRDAAPSAGESPPAGRGEPAGAASPPRRPAFREVTVPAGTAIPLELMTDLASNTAKVEAPVRARVKQALTIDGAMALPAGTVFIGHVTDVEDAGRVKGRARLSFRFTEAEINDVRHDVQTNPLSYQAEATRGEDATKIGAGAGIGAVIGGIVGGGEGAAKGAAIGGAAGTGAVLATKGRDVRLPVGSDLAATLAQPLTVRASVE